MSVMQKMMFTIHASELDFDATVEAVIESAEKNGWKIPMVHDLQENYRQSGYEDMTRLKVIYFCNPDGGDRMLQDDDNKPMSVMTPMGVSVYETLEGEVYIAGLNLERLGLMFSGTVKEVLQDDARNFSRTMDGFAEPVAGEAEIEVSGKQCLLGCLSVTAVLAALLGVFVVVMTKIMPVVMPKLMEKMMLHSFQKHRHTAIA